jgi:hypothetical protein
VKVHAIISAAMSLAVRYEWIERNPGRAGDAASSRQAGAAAA